jgi:putative peptidoglycan lipid II flippase
MGDSWVAGAFQFAFAIPNLFRRLLGEGALTAAFIPIFKEKERTASEAEMWRAANAVISGLIVAASIITAIAMLGITLVLGLQPKGKEGAAPFTEENVKDVRSLAARLSKQSDPVSRFLWDRFSPATRERLLAYGGTIEQKKILRTGLAEEFERAARSGSLYDPTLFSQVTLSPPARNLLAQNPQGYQIVQLNRLLIEDTYALEVSDKLIETDLMLRLLRVMFPYMLVICLTAVFMGILNARGHFFIPACGALIMNTVMIASVFLLAPRLGKTLPEQIFALGFGVLVAGVAQAAFQLPTLYAGGFRYHWVSPWGDTTVLRVVRQMIPGAIGVAAFQLNVVMIQGVAFWIDPTINASFQYAVRLMELPQGVFGISLATYMLPTLSGFAVEKKFDEFRATLKQGLDHIIFINLLAAVLLLALAEPIIRLLFERGAFSPDATHRAAFALACLTPGLIAFSLANILARAFYALGDTKTPMKISIFCLGINMAFALVLVHSLRQGGLGIANSVSATCNASLLLFALRRKLGRLELKTMRNLVIQMAGAALVAGLIAWSMSDWWENAIGSAGLWRRLGAVFVPMTAASLAYWMITLWMKIPPAMEIGNLVTQRIRRKQR